MQKLIHKFVFGIKVLVLSTIISGVVYAQTHFTEPCDSLNGVWHGTRYWSYSSSTINITVNADSYKNVTRLIIKDTRGKTEVLEGTCENGKIVVDHGSNTIYRGTILGNTVHLKTMTTPDYWEYFFTKE